MKRLCRRLSILFNGLSSKKMSDNKDILISFMTEKKVGYGEDAPPLLIAKGKGCAVGVFDGMGGAGAKICESSSLGLGHTQAYLSSEPSSHR